LSHEEVRNAMYDSDALRLYDKGLNYNKKAKILIWTGVVTLLPIVPGLILKSKARKYIRQSVEMYNGNRHTSSSDIKG
jgi:hypothetical protein